MTTTADCELASYLTQCRRAATAIDIPAGRRPADIARGYHVQQARHNALDGARGGFKIGCTTPVMQEFLGIGHPCGGIVREQDIHASGVQIDTGRHVRPAVECEIAVRLKHAPVGTNRGQLLASIHSVMASIELVDDRYVDFADLGVPALIADDFFHVGLVLGEEIEFSQDMDLSLLRGHIDVNQKRHGDGVGADIMGDPINALQWLVRQYQGTPYEVREGDVVSLGSVVETWWASAGESIQIEFDVLGTVSCEFA